MQWVDTVRQIRNPLFLRYKALPSLSPPPFFGFVLPLSATSRQYFLRTNQPAQVKSTCRLVLFSRIRTNHSEIGIYCCCCVVIVSSFLFFFLFKPIPLRSTFQPWLLSIMARRLSVEGRDGFEASNVFIVFRYFSTRYD